MNDDDDIQYSMSNPSASPKNCLISRSTPRASGLCGLCSVKQQQIDNVWRWQEASVPSERFNVEHCPGTQATHGHTGPHS